MIKVIVTGSKGFIGKNILSSLSHKKEFESLGLDLPDFFLNLDWQKDLLNFLNKFKPEAIFHVGACSDTLNTDVNYMMSLNFECSRIISDWCSANQSKLIYSSSAANYGIDGKLPSNLYGWSKYMGECYVVSKGGIALRYFNVYGRGESHKGRMASFIYQAFSRKNSGKDIKIFPGYPKRDFVYIEDVISANLFALINFNSLRSDWYDVGCGESNTFEEVLNILGVNHFGYTDENEIPKGYQFFTESSKFMQGWKPKYNLESGIKDYIKWFEIEQNLSYGF